VSPSRLVFYEEGGGFGIAGVAGAEIGGRDEPRLGLGSHMGLVAVAVGVLGLVGMA
jgi:hypothetical protein